VNARRPRAARIAAGPAALLVLHADGTAPAVLDGVCMLPGVLVALPPGTGCWLRTTGPGGWLALALGTAPATMDGWTSPRALLPGAAMRAALVRPVRQMQANDAAAEADALRAAAIALAAPAVARTASEGRRALMARFEHLVALSLPRGTGIQDAAARLNVAARTLRACVSDFAGIGPARFAMHRRMQRVHATLLNATPGQARVTEIALAHGFGELGRFSVAYRGLFGEPPSATLARTPPATPGPDAMSGPACILRLEG
jgi:methylphosphotriester-DNA--protein-cysteine methyltransferase